MILPEQAGFQSYHCAVICSSGCFPVSAQRGAPARRRNFSRTSETAGGLQDPGERFFRVFLLYPGPFCSRPPQSGWLQCFIMSYKCLVTETIAQLAVTHGTTPKTASAFLTRWLSSPGNHPKNLIKQPELFSKEQVTYIIRVFVIIYFFNLEVNVTHNFKTYCSTFIKQYST